MTVETSKCSTTSDDEAKEWAFCVNSFKFTVDSMYEICRNRNNVMGCKEAIIYLSNAVRDFQSLIESINLEAQWENAENRPQAVAWEVKGAVSGRKLGLQSRNVATITEPMERQGEWQVVQSRAKRRKTNSDSGDEAADPSVTPKKSANVFERLSYGQRPHSQRGVPPVNQLGDDSDYAEEMRRNGFASGRLMCPRSAMDLPQTKSSMAKIAYSRQLLWQKHKKLLTEKLTAKRRQQQLASSMGNRGRSLPSLKDAKVERRGSLEKKLPTKGVDLESINEADEGEKAVDTSSLTTLADFTTRSDPRGYAMELLDMSADDEWRAMTEEEESLAQEEESLKKEIEEEESLSIDDEVHRRVSLDFDDIEIDHESRAQQMKPAWREVVAKWALGEPKPPQAIPTPTSPSKKHLTVSQPPDNTHYRRPGEAVQLHQKLLSPSRKRFPDDKRYEERLHKAEEIRLRLQEERAKRLGELNEKVQEVRQKREELIEKKRLHLEVRMQKAEENRQKNLSEIVKKARDGDQKVMEVNFIVSTEAENMKHDLQLRQKDREARITELVEERARRMEEKAAKEAAAEERRKVLDQELNERQQKRLDREKARQEQAEVQRNGMMEAMRKKARQRDQKIEDRKACELVEAQNLITKIQLKQDEGTRRHEESLDLVKQKAMDMCSPRLVPPWVSLADCSSIPTDVPYRQKANSDIVINPRRKCVVCKIELIHDLELIAHLCSPSHLEERGVAPTDVSFEFLKMELETSIESHESDSMQSSVISVMETSITSAVTPAVKKRRLKLRQKMAKQEGAVESVHKLSGPTSGEKNPQEKKVKITLALLKSKTLSDNDKSALERALMELTSKIVPRDNKESISSQIIAYLQSTGLVDALLLYCSAEEHAGNMNTSRPLYLRLLGKVLSFLSALTASDSKLGHGIFFSNHLVQLFDAVARNSKQSQSADQQAVLLETAFLCFFLNRVFASAAVTKAVDEAIATSCNERLNLLCAYATTTNFTDVILEVLKAVGDGSIPETVELTKELAFNVPVTLIDLLLPLARASILSGSLKRHAVGGDAVVPPEDCVAVVRPIFDYVVVTLYRHFCHSTRSNDSSSSGINSSSTADSVRSQVIPPTILPHLCKSLLLMWNSFFADSMGKHVAEVLCKSSENHCLPLRLVHILSALAQHGANGEDGGLRQLLSDTIVAAGYFASLSPYTQMLCVLGWQKSLLLHLCRLPFDYLQDAKNRRVIMPTLIVMLYRSPTALDAIKGDLSCSWMVSFLEDTASLDRDTRNRMEVMLSANLWTDALEFFKNAI